MATLVHRSPTYEIAFYHDAARPETLQTLLSAIDKDAKLREKQRQGLLDQLRSEAIRDLNEENLKKATATSRDEE